MGPVRTQNLNQNLQQQNAFQLGSPVASETSNFGSRIEDYKSGIELTLQSIFPTKQEETKLQKARRILGDIAIDIPDHELESDLAEFQYLIDSWLDEFEKNNFNDKTLIEILREG